MKLDSALCRRVGAEPEEPPRQGPLVAAGGREKAPFLDGHAAVRDLPMVEPAPPDEAVALLPFGRVRQERAEELASPLLAEVDVGDGDPAAEPDVLPEEDLRRDEARHEQALEDVPGHDPALWDVAPARRLRQILGQGNLGNATALVHAEERIVERPDLAIPIDALGVGGGNRDEPDEEGGQPEREGCPAVPATRARATATRGSARGKHAPSDARHRHSGAAGLRPGAPR